MRVNKTPVVDQKTTTTTTTPYKPADKSTTPSYGTDAYQDAPAPTSTPTPPEKPEAGGKKHAKKAKKGPNGRPFTDPDFKPPGRPFADAGFKPQGRPFQQLNDEKHQA